MVPSPLRSYGKECIPSSLRRFRDLCQLPLTVRGFISVCFFFLHGSPAARSESTVRSRSQAPPLSSLPEDAPHAKILRLLRVLHQLNTMEAERVGFIAEKRNLPEASFVNNKLTAKLTRQLEEPMIVARYGCL